MVEFFSGFGIIIALCVAALIIDSKRDNSIVDNFPEYKKMFEEGIIKSTRRNNWSRS